MQINFDRSDKYIDKALKDIDEHDAEDALFHIRRALETAIDQINKATGFKYKSLDNEFYIYRMIDDLIKNDLITVNEGTLMHQIRAISNRGVHEEMNEAVGGQFAAEDVVHMMEELIKGLKDKEWDLTSLSRYCPKKVGRQKSDVSISPFVPKI